MTNVWYKSSVEIKKYFDKYGEFENLEVQLEEIGIIYEGDFDGLVTSNFIEHAVTALNELFLDVDSENSYIGSAIEIKEEGWMYFLFDPDKLTLEQAQKMANCHFRKK